MRRNAIYIEEQKEEEFRDQLKQVNQSVLDTNDSVRHTNNQTTENFIIQKRLTRASILVAIASIIVSAGVYLKDDSKELKSTNKLIEQQQKTLDSLLQMFQKHQPAVVAAGKDSVKKK